MVLTKVRNVTCHAFYRLIIGLLCQKILIGRHCPSLLLYRQSKNNFFKVDMDGAIRRKQFYGTAIL